MKKLILISLLFLSVNIFAGAKQLSPIAKFGEEKQLTSCPGLESMMYCREWDGRRINSFSPKEVTSWICRGPLKYDKVRGGYKDIFNSLSKKDLLENLEVISYCSPRAYVEIEAFEKVINRSTTGVLFFCSNKLIKGHQEVTKYFKLPNSIVSQQKCLD